ncbi:MAG: hypothetical protein RIS64_749 [Bacteroidota bacterium]|jgi:hypothetical protein
MKYQTNRLKNDYKQSFRSIYNGFQGLFLLVLTILKTVFYACAAFYKAITKDVEHHDFSNNHSPKLNKKF